MHQLLTYLADHHAELALGAWVVLSIVNASLRYDAMRDGGAVKRVVGDALDRLAVLARRDSRAWLVLPGFPSPPPPPPPRLPRGRRPTPVVDLPAPHPRGDDHSER